MTPIIYKLTDNVLIKGNSSSNSPQTVSVQTIVNYAIAQGYGNAFMLIDGGSSFSGSAIRFFTISGNTAYLGSTDFLSLNPYNIGISDGTSTNSNITSTTKVGYCYNGSSFNAISVAYNWGNYTKNNILYYTQGGNTSGNYGYQTGYYLPDTITNIYIDEEPVLTYAWTPVSSVYGKLGTINLSKLKDINDGEPVTGASSSAVNLTDKSLISILVGNVIVDDNKVGVEYSIPSGTYEYIKLVYKQDSEPEDASDGTAIDLEIGDGVIGISGINDGNTYFFKIFTDINASQAYEFTTEKPVVPPEYESYIDIINGSGFWWKNWPNKNYYNANQEGMTIYPPTLLSWISNYDDYSYSFTPTAARSQYCYVCNIQDVYITSNNNVYSVNYVISGSQQAFLYNNNPGWLGNVFTNQTFATCYLGQNPDGTTMSTSGTLAQVLSWMSYRFRNVNIYVDNVCWSKVN